MSIDLSGRVVLVTGGSRGIGKEIGRRFAGAGAKVALADVVDEAQIQASADEIGRGAIAVSANVTDPEH
ncbi:MAG: SDR family NAD(P)-dependent oxidoreductase, partial [Gemmatimonadetes bacterium]|nr:SDR family NAD(P)-dependent oxidoreductase [Gemmatimonadota bacterium]